MEILTDHNRSGYISIIVIAADGAYKIVLAGLESNHAIIENKESWSIFRNVFMKLVSKLIANHGGSGYFNRLPGAG